MAVRILAAHRFSQGWIPAFAGMTKEYATASSRDRGPDLLPPTASDPDWIPAFAGMTKG